MTDSCKPTVSIIDDDSSVRKSLVALVEASGYSTVSFESAEAFLDQGQPSEADFVIVDVRLPGMSGIDLLDELVRRGCQTPAVVITGHADGQEFSHRRHLTDVTMLSKPSDPERLLEAIEAALKRERP